MRTLKFIPFLIGLLLILVAACEPLLKPSKFLAEHDRVNLAHMIPEHFLEWHQDHQAISGIVDAQADAALRRLYDQNIVRTYMNTDGQRIMLNIAYGRDQASDQRLHPPEICYRANGFMLSDTRTARLNHAYGALPIKQFVGRIGPRNEPVTYWISYGDFAVVGEAQSRLAKIRYVFSGVIPDGILFRVSSVNSQADSEAFALHEKFIKDLITSLSDQDRKALVKPLP
jgi:EpsI family protein